MTARQHFLAMSNARCGSTYLQTSSARLPDCATDFALIWEGENPAAKANPPFSYVVRKDWDWRGFLDGLSETAAVTGTRVVRHGTADFRPEEADDFIASIPRDVAIVHVVRDYFDILKSSRIRDHITWVSDDALDKAEAGNAGDGEAYLWQGLRETGMRSVDGWRNPGDPPFEYSQHVLSRLFINDLVITEVARRAERRIVLAFEDIRDRFHEVATVIGSRCSKEDCDRIMHEPVTRRLPPIPGEELQHWEVLRHLCDMLNAGLRSFIAHEIPMNKVWTGTELRVPSEKPN